MGRKYLLRQKAQYEKLAAYAVEVGVLAGLPIVLLAQVFLLRKTAAPMLIAYCVIVGAGILLSRYDVIKNAFVIVFTMIMCFTMLALSTPFVFIMQGVIGVKKYWKIRIKHCIKVLMVR